MAKIEGTDAGEILNGTTADDQIYGYGGNDTLDGGGGNDILDGGTGLDNMTGGTGDDTYYVDSGFGEFVNEQAGEGTDRVYVLTSLYVLPLNVENGTVYVTSGVTLAGNALANILTGNSGDDVLSGADGNDTLRGGAGNDTLSGGNGNDMLNGGLGNDSMAGGAGNDGYSVDSLSDVITEQAGQGIDRVYLLTSNYVLPNYVENGTVSITSGVALTGNNLGNSLVGNSGNDIFYGLNGNDTLNGGAGNDTLVGGIGNDSYYVDSLSDVVTEQAGEGTDRVYVQVSDYVLPTNVEIGTVMVAAGVTLTGNSLANTLTGNNGDDIFFGLDGNDTLRGGAGSDTLVGGIGNDLLNGGAGIDNMTGGTGNDSYYVDSLSDAVTEQAGEGTDRVYVQTSSYVLPTNVESGTVAITSGATLAGNSLANSLIGNSGNDFLYGLGGSDTLKGGDGNDTLDGGAGRDKLDGGLGSDTIIGGAGIDTISAVDHAVDTIVYQSVADALIPTDLEHYWELETVTLETGYGSPGTTHDIIDLSAIDANTLIAGDQAFILVDNSTPTGPGELYVSAVSPGTALIYADVDGGGADFAILIHYTGELTPNLIL